MIGVGPGDSSRIGLPMNRRNTLRTIGGIGLAGILGTGASGTAAAGDHGSGGRDRNPGHVATYNGRTTKTAPGLGGFDKVLPYIADPDPDWEGEVSAQRYQEEIMDRSREEALADKNAGIDFFEERFGLEFPEADMDTLYESVDTDGEIDATLNPTMLCPGTGYAESGRGRISRSVAPRRSLGMMPVPSEHERTIAGTRRSSLDPTVRSAGRASGDDSRLDRDER